MIPDFTQFSTDEFRYIEFNDKNSLTDMGLVMNGNSPLSVAEQKSVTTELAYGDGSKDFSRIDGRLHFKDRTIQYQFLFVADELTDLNDKLSEIQTWLYEYSDIELYDSGYGDWKFVNARCTGFTVQKGIYPETLAAQITVTFTFDPWMVSTTGKIIPISEFAMNGGDDLEYNFLAGKIFSGPLNSYPARRSITITILSRSAGENDTLPQVVISYAVDLSKNPLTNIAGYSGLLAYKLETMVGLGLYVEKVEYYSQEDEDASEVVYNSFIVYPASQTIGYTPVHNGVFKLKLYLRGQNADTVTVEDFFLGTTVSDYCKIVPCYSTAVNYNPEGESLTGKNYKLVHYSNGQYNAISRRMDGTVIDGTSSSSNGKFQIAPYDPDRNDPITAYNVYASVKDADLSQDFVYTYRIFDNKLFCSDWVEENRAQYISIPSGELRYNTDPQYVDPWDTEKTPAILARIICKMINVDSLSSYTGYLAINIHSPMQDLGESSVKFTRILSRTSYPLTIVYQDDYNITGYIWVEKGIIDLDLGFSDYIADFADYRYKNGGKICNFTISYAKAKEYVVETEADKYTKFKLYGGEDMYNVEVNGTAVTWYSSTGESSEYEFDIPMYDPSQEVTYQWPWYKKNPTRIAVIDVAFTEDAVTAGWDTIELGHTVYIVDNSSGIISGEFINNPTALSVLEISASDDIFFELSFESAERRL